MGKVQALGHTLLAGLMMWSAPLLAEFHSQEQQNTIPQHSLEVVSGEGSGVYPEGALVKISAYPSLGLFTFDRWVGDTHTVSDIFSPQSKIKVTSALSVRAEYRSLDQRTPFRMIAPELPAIIEAEDFDVGAEGTTHWDSTSKNLGEYYRNDESVDIYRFQSDFLVGTWDVDEWLEYTVVSRRSQTLNLQIHFRDAVAPFRVRICQRHAQCVEKEIRHLGSGTAQVGQLSFVEGYSILRLELRTQENIKSPAIDFFEFYAPEQGPKKFPLSIDGRHSWVSHGEAVRMQAPHPDRFRFWTGNREVLADPYQALNKFTMPRAPITLHSVHHARDDNE